MVSGEFSGLARQDGNEVVVELKGNGDGRSQADLEQFISRVENGAKTLKVSAVRVDLRDAQFMNSSCLKVLVSWLARLQEQPADQQHKVVFISDPAKHWQKRSLTPLSLFAPELVEIRT